MVFMAATRKDTRYYNFVPIENLCQAEGAWQAPQTIYILYIILYYSASTDEAVCQSVGMSVCLSVRVSI